MRHANGFATQHFLPAILAVITLTLAACGQRVCDFDLTPPQPSLTSPIRQAGLRNEAPRFDFFGQARDGATTIGAVQR